MAKTSIVLLLLAAPLLAQKPGRGKKKDTSPPVDSLSWQRALPTFVRGMVYFSQSLYEEATDYLSQAAEAAPHSSGIHHYLAQVAYRQSDPIRMLTHAEKAYKEAPREVWLGLGYAYALMLNSQRQEAIRVLEELHRLYPTDPEVLHRLAQTYQAVGDWQRADAYYQKLQQLGGSSEELFQARVQLLVEAGQLGRAIALAESLLTLWPTHEVYWEVAARLYELSQNLPRMAQTLTQLLQLDPANSLAWGLVLTYADYFEDVWEEGVWERFLESYAVPVEVKYALLRRIALLDEEDYRAALAQLLADYPSPAGWELWAQYWQQKGRWDSVALAWQRVFALDSTQAAAYWAYLYALWRLGGGDSLARAVELGKELFPGQGRLFWWEGVVAAQRKQCRRALSAFARGWRLLPEPDTVTAQTVLYYQLLCELQEGSLTPQTQALLSRWYKEPWSSGLVQLFNLRVRPHAPEGSSPSIGALPSPYGEWGAFLLSVQQGRMEEARRAAASLAEKDTQLPLELWQDLLTRLSESLVGTAYYRWKARARAQYPLADL